MRTDNKVIPKEYRICPVCGHIGDSLAPLSNKDLPHRRGILCLCRWSDCAVYLFWAKLGR